MAGLTLRWPFRREALLVSILFVPLLVALPVTFLLWRHPFDGLYGQDAYAYHNYATGPLRSSLLSLAPLPPFYWPPGYPMLTALVSLISGPIPFAGQFVSLICGALVPVFTALLANELRLGTIDNRRLMVSPAVVVSTLLVALTPQLWQSSAVIMPDTTALAFATFAAWALARYGHTRRLRWLVPSVAACAFAVLTRLAYAPLALPFTLYALLVLARIPWARRALHVTVGAAVALLVLSPLLFSLATVVGAVREPLLQPAAPFLANLGDVPWRLRHALQDAFVTPSGAQQYRQPNGLYYALAPASPYFFTPLLMPFLLLGLWRLCQRLTAARALLLLAWPAVIYITLISYPFQNLRFTLALLPPLAIITALGIAHLKFKISNLIILVFAIALLWMTYGGWTLGTRFVLRKQNELATVRWVQEQVAPQAQLFTFAITLAFEQYTDLEVYDVYVTQQPEISALLEHSASSGAPAYLLLDVSNIETQWTRHAPGRNYRWLQDDVGLTRLGQHRQYTLFRIQAANTETSHAPS